MNIGRWRRLKATDDKGSRGIESAVARQLTATPASLPGEKAAAENSVSRIHPSDVKLKSEPAQATMTTLKAT